MAHMHGKSESKAPSRVESGTESGTESDTREAENATRSQAELHTAVDVDIANFLPCAEETELHDQVFKYYADFEDASEFMCDSYDATTPAFDDLSKTEQSFIKCCLKEGKSSAHCDSMFELVCEVSEDTSWTYLSKVEQPFLHT